MATVQQVTDIMGEFYSRELESELYQPFFDCNDIGMPVAFMCWRGMATPTEKSTYYLNSTWIEFCEMFEIDPLCQFDTLDEFLEFLTSVE